MVRRHWNMAFLAMFTAGLFVGIWVSPEAKVHPKAMKPTGPVLSTRTKSELVRRLREKLSTEFPDIMAQVEMFEQLQAAATAATASRQASGGRKRKSSLYDQDYIPSMYDSYQPENVGPVEVPMGPKRRKSDRVVWFMDNLGIRPSDAGTAYVPYTFDREAVIPFCFADGYRAQMIGLCGATWTDSSVQACKGAFKGWTCGTNSFIMTTSLYPLQYDYRLRPRLLQEQAFIEQPPFDGTQPPALAVNGPVFHPPDRNSSPGSVRNVAFPGKELRALHSVGGVDVAALMDTNGPNRHSVVLNSVDPADRISLQRQSLSSPTPAPCTRNFEPVCCRVDGISQPVVNMCTCKSMYGVFIAPGPVCPPGIGR